MPLDTATQIAIIEAKRAQLEAQRFEYMLNADLNYVQANHCTGASRDAYLQAEKSNRNEAVFCKIAITHCEERIRGLLADEKTTPALVED